MLPQITKKSEDSIIGKIFAVSKIKEKIFIASLKKI